MKYIYLIFDNLRNNRQIADPLCFFIIISLILIIHILHYLVIQAHPEYHFILLQGNFIPIIIASGRFGMKGGLFSAFFISMIDTFDIVPGSGVFIRHELSHLVQIVFYFLIGFLSALKTKYGFHTRNLCKKTGIDINENLRKIKEQSDRLIEMEEQLRLSDRLAVIGELTVGLVHELRNPLSTIISTIEMIQEDCFIDLNGNKYFRILIEETNRLKKFIENYLNFTHKRARKKVLYDVKEVIKNAKIMFSGKAFKNGSKIKIYLPEYPIQLLGNSNHLWQIIMNLLLNALQSMSNGGEINISVNKVKAGEVNFSRNGMDANQELLQLIIADQGIGIAQEKLQKIFQPFYTTKPTGTGLGLSIVKNIVDENEWQIEVKSEQNMGTEFRLFIPLL
jgi:two-component system sensor histidine kinase HydH